MVFMELTAAKELKRIRESMRYTLKEFARILEVTETHFHRAIG